MKKILIALIVMGVANISASAQSKTSTANQNYSVCVNKSSGTYYTCGKTTVKTTTSATRVRKINKMDRAAWTPTSEPATNMDVNTVNSYEGYYRKHNIVVSDDMNNPYQGKPSQQYDGPAKNDYRNMNVNQTSIYLAPSSGNNSK